MLNNRNILCLSVPAWKGDYAATIVELMKVLGRTNKVFYVQNPYTIKDVLSAVIGRKKFPYAQAFGFRSRVSEVRSEQGTIYVFTAPVLLTINFLPPGVIYTMLSRSNGWLLRRSVSRHLHKKGMDQELINIVAFNPILGLVTARRFNEKVLLYHCYDEIGEAVWMKKHGAAAEKKFMRLVDGVVVTSRGLYEKKSELTDNCFLVKNAADIALFSTAFNENITPHKTVGYIGSLDNRIDYDLLVQLAASMPAVTFMLVGRIVDKAGTDRLRVFDNVRFTGPKDLAELPAIVTTFSAGIIPFVLNEFTKGIYPLKINEYLAAGIPVISTHFSYLDDFTGVISVGDDHADFQEKLVREIETDSVQKRKGRQLAASENTWENRAEQLSGILSNLEQTIK